MAEASHAAFLSYAWQDVEAAQKIRETSRADGIEVFPDQGKLRGGDASDRQIPQQICDCAFVHPRNFAAQSGAALGVSS